MNEQVKLLCEVYMTIDKEFMYAEDNGLSEEYKEGLTSALHILSLYIEKLDTK